MTRDEFIELSAEFAVSDLEPGDLGRLSEYLRSAGGNDARAFVELQNTAALLPLALEQQSPPAHLKERILHRIRIADQAAAAAQRRTTELAALPVQKRSWLPFGVTFVTLAMIVGFSLYVVRLMGTIDQQSRFMSSLEKQNESLASEIIALKDELSQKQAMLDVLASKSIGMAMMSGMEVNPVGYGKILWDPERGIAILQVANLPGIPSDKDYQLWVIRDKPISAGVFSVTSESDKFFMIKNMAVTDPKLISAFAITLEPKGGMPQPTGEMYMAGSPKKL